ncbi:MAG: phosphatidylglycerophosphatase A [Planctomycetes bacterium]|nr:phosphatidylglycerophosphatase A [Planctomycetota bacterium]
MRIGKFLRLAAVTAGGAGLIPFGPGTFGSLVGLIVLMMLPAGESYIYWCAAAAAVATFLCIALGPAAERDFKEKDPQRFVLDEVAGMLVAGLAFTRPPIYWLVAAFALFRFFDIKKPLGIAKMQRFKAGVGIVADDLAAGVCALALVHAARAAAQWIDGASGAMHS